MKYVRVFHLTNVQPRNLLIVLPILGSWARLLPIAVTVGFLEAHKKGLSGARINILDQFPVSYRILESMFPLETGPWKVMQYQLATCIRIITLRKKQERE
jgi:hypothetical protein